MSTTPDNQQGACPETPLNLAELDRIIDQTMNLVRQMLRDALGRIRALDASMLP